MNDAMSNGVSNSTVRDSKKRRYLWLVVLLAILAPALYCTKVIKLPRPMFHNFYAYHPDGRPPWPRWWMNPPLVDEYGHWGWADYDDNVLVIVATGVPSMSRFGAMRSGQKLSEFRVGDDREDQFVSVGRTTNQLVVILPDGSVGRFTLSDGDAHRYYEQRESAVVENVLQEAAELLSETERLKYLGFREGYKAPMPTSDSDE